MVMKVILILLTVCTVLNCILLFGLYAHTGRIREILSKFKGLI